MTTSRRSSETAGIAPPPELADAPIAVNPDGTVVLTRKLFLEGGTIEIRAKNVRGEHTGTHATIFLFHNKQLLAYSDFNVLRDVDRTRLGNKAHKRLPPTVASLYPE